MLSGQNWDRMYSPKAVDTRHPTPLTTVQPRSASLCAQTDIRLDFRHERVDRCVIQSGEKRSARRRRRAIRCERSSGEARVELGRRGRCCWSARQVEARYVGSFFSSVIVQDTANVKGHALANQDIGSKLISLSTVESDFSLAAAERKLGRSIEQLSSMAAAQVSNSLHGGMLEYMLTTVCQ